MLNVLNNDYHLNQKQVSYLKWVVSGFQVFQLWFSLLSWAHNILSYPQFILMGVRRQLSEYLTFFYVEIKTTDVELNGFFLKECVSVKNLKVTEKSCLKGEKCRFALISFTKHSIHLTVFSYKSVKHLDRAEINRYTPTVKQKHLQANNCKGSFKPIWKAYSLDRFICLLQPEKKHKYEASRFYQEFKVCTHREFNY